MSKPLSDLLELLNLEEIELNIFRGRSPKDSWQRVFGGQVLGQALVAATRTVPDERYCHSMHAYFIRPGDPKVPILYQVDRARDGRSFATRRVVAVQHGRPIFSLSASFQTLEDGLEHQIDMPDVPAPDTLIPEEDLRKQVAEQLPPAIAKWFTLSGPIELRPVNPKQRLNPVKGEPKQNIWVRSSGTLPDDLSVHQCVLAYASDMTLLDTCLIPHGIGFLSEGLQIASLDHGMWFHRPFRADEWLLYSQDSPVSGGSRGFNRGSIFTRDGVLVASVAQEGLIRMRKQKQS